MSDEAFTNHRRAAGVRRAGPRSTAGAVGRESPELRQQQFGEAPPGGHRRRDHGARDSAPGDRRPARQPTLGRPGVRRVCRLRRGAGVGGGLRRKRAGIRVPARLSRRLPASAAGQSRWHPVHCRDRRGFPRRRLRLDVQVDALLVDITAPVWAIDLALPAVGPPNTSTSGCQAADYAGVPVGAIIIVQRGTCTFAEKFALADASPAGAMVFINEGQPGRTVPLWFNFDGIDIPTVAATIDTGMALANGVLSGFTGVTARFKIDWRPGMYTTSNVIAETTAGDPDNVIVVGAHLDSVGVGPGINDNGSGSAVILEIAEQMTKVNPRNKVRFIWFGAEESGLLGSEAYVAGLRPRNGRTDRRDAELRHGRLTELRSLRLRRRPVRLTAAAGWRTRRFGADRESCSSTTSRTRVCRRCRRHSTADPTTGRSSEPGSPRAGCSPGPKGSRPPNRQRSSGDRRRTVRPLLPPLVRHIDQPEPHRALTR